MDAVDWLIKEIAVMIIGSIITGTPSEAVAQANSFDGVWRPQITNDGSSDPACSGFVANGTIRIVGGKVSGTIRHDRGGDFDLSGTIGPDGSMSHVVAAGARSNVTFTGKIEGTSGKGRWSGDVIGCQGDWTLKKVS